MCPLRLHDTHQPDGSRGLPVLRSALPARSIAAALRNPGVPVGPVRADPPARAAMTRLGRIFDAIGRAAAQAPMSALVAAELDHHHKEHT